MLRSVDLFMSQRLTEDIFVRFESIKLKFLFLEVGHSSQKTLEFDRIMHSSAFQLGNRIVAHWCKSEK